MLPTISAPDHEHGAVGVTHDRVRDAAHERPPHSAQAPTPRDDQAGLQLLAELDDRLVGLAEGQMRFLDFGPRSFYELRLLIYPRPGLALALLEVLESFLP
jgi:hypothetical protein